MKLWGERERFSPAIYNDGAAVQLTKRRNVYITRKRVHGEEEDADAL